MTGMRCAALAVAAFVVVIARVSRGEVLNPPYFNLAEGRRIWATATCGEGLSEPELYCKLVGANLDRQDTQHQLIQGQVCDHCDPSDLRRAHPAEYAIDGTQRWWQSPPLSRGSKFNEVNLTIDLGQEFHVAYVFIKMANSPRPGVWILERSKDNGQTYTPWQYFADTPSDCIRYFGPESLSPITRDDSVICETKFSKVVPLEGGEIVISLLNGRPSAENFSQSAVLQEWTKATNVRLRLLRTKTLLGHLMSIARQDPTVTRRYFYSIKDVNIGGRCVCNGHADTCDITDPNDPSKLLCRCQHNTCGAQCEKCCPGFVQKQWRRATVENPNACEACNCYGHSDECEYDEEIDRMGQSIDIHGQYKGGGKCLNCQHNTEGINCNRCKQGFYRPFGKELNATDVCQPCQCDLRFSTGNCFDGWGKCECRPEFRSPDCDECSVGYYDYPECKPCDCNLNGTQGEICEVGGGQCPCKPNYDGKSCDRCAEGYYGFPLCLPCDCNPIGATKPMCDVESGQCTCAHSFGGRQCDVCIAGFYAYPSCKYCDCDPTGTTEEICDQESGKCTCKPGYGGPRCDQCAPGYFGYPNCVECGCNAEGSADQVCDLTGKCRCLPNFAGQKCDNCYPGHYSYPQCLACNCDPSGSHGVSCDNDGLCTCHPNFDGEKCDRCKEGFYNYPICEECNCNPAGILATFAGCGSLTSGELCECKERVVGRICDSCQPLYWNLKAANPLGCEDCNCNTAGTMGRIGICDSVSGQCVCKPNVMSRQCDECADGSFHLQEENLFGCQDCGCDIGGAVSTTCDKATGQCACRPRITGRKCDRPLQTHYFPSLYQHQFELEDGRTPSGTPVRFGFDNNSFPSFSWRGYAVFSELQREIVLSIYIDKPSLYRAMMYYLNYGGENIYGTITFIPETSGEIQISDMVFQPSSQPRMMVVSGKQGLVIPPFVLNPGYWHVSIKIEKPLFVDYLVLLPQAYYEATLLQEDTNKPCHCGQDPENFCRQFQYPSLPDGSTVRGEAGYIDSNGSRKRTQLYTNTTILEELGVGSMALLNEEQNTVMMDLRIPKPGQYVLVLLYHTPEDLRSTIVAIETATDNQMVKGQAVVYACDYNFICRQVVTDYRGQLTVFSFDSNFIQVTVTTNDDVEVAIDGIAAIPYESWSLDYLMPQPVCIRRNGQCVELNFPLAPGATKVECESGQNAERIATVQPSTIQDDQAKLIFLDYKDDVVDVQGSVPEEGWYTMVVHYYQPDHPGFTMDVLIQNGQFYDAVVHLKHCPNSEGCRAVIQTRDTNTTIFQIMQNFIITFKEPNHKTVWLDYILAIPSDQYDPMVLHPQKKDLAGDFITQCGQSNFHISSDAEGFCRDAAFSLSAEYNNGAVPCNCNIDGSRSFECEVFGGQCYCKPNIIGRTCSQCRTGYYGFPDCKPCDCPSTALCHAKTGQCVCPPRVTGEKCDSCIQFSYGFDPIIGCEECDCNPLGVNQGNLQCDLHTGQCLCKMNVQGRTCDRCKAGYWSFPFCQLCNCDLRGTMDEICDQDTAQCFCKENVYGESCSQCKPGTFFLEESNPSGCTKCFCFGTTDRCKSSSLKRIQVLEMTGWRGVGLGLDTQVSEQPINATIDDSSGDVEVLLLSDMPTGTLFYFAAPKEYLGNKITSYGGMLTFTIHVTLENDESAGGIVGPDLILTGNNITLIHDHWEQPAAGLPMHVSLQVVETEFRHPSGADVTREQMMMVLVNLDGLYIRGSYFQPQSDMFKLSDVLLDIAVEGLLTDTTQAMRVEQCFCPPNYQGSSCEECAPGYYRAKTGPYLGYCVPCQCHGHAETCDVNTGKCIDCLHNTVGDHCEKCGPGYHGDATQGTPYDCLICACPLPIPSNNFATACELSESGHEIHCTCKPGYYGARCDVCAAGYFGRPEVPGESCQPCECSGNINPDQPGSCDSVTGECVLCLNNTFGSACELCAPGFYGDAVNKKDCRACDCDKCGTLECSHEDGACHCHLGVVGEKCDHCAADHWGFRNCSGCRPCNCGLASRSSQCDVETGQCDCKPGVGGLTCEVCKPGFWKYSPSGCVSCNCDEKYSAGVGCDPLTGQCQCLPGVIGEKCDRCPHRWAFIKDHGCIECEPCVHFLLDDTDELNDICDHMTEELSGARIGLFALRRLRLVNETVNEFQPEVEKLHESSFWTDASDLLIQVGELEKKAKDHAADADTILGNSMTLSEDANNVHKDALEAQDKTRMTSAKAQGIVQQVWQLVEDLSKGASANIEYMIIEAKYILEELRNRDFTPSEETANNELELAQDLLKKVKDFHTPSDEQDQMVFGHQERLNHIEKLLDELQNYSQVISDIVQDAEKFIDDSKQYLDQQIQDQLLTLQEETTSMLAKARELVGGLMTTMEEMSNLFDDLTEVPEQIQSKPEEMKEILTNNWNELEEVKPLLKEVEEHSNYLVTKAAKINSTFDGSRRNWSSALQAANAYNDIVQAIQDALTAAESAKAAANEAGNMSDGVAEKATESKDKSESLRTEALNLQHRVNKNLAPAANDALERLKDLSDTDSKLKRDDYAINLELDRLPVGNLEALADEVADNARETETKVLDTKDEIQDILDELPEVEAKVLKFPQDVKDTNAALLAAHNYVNRTLALIPHISTRIDRVEERDKAVKALGNDVTARIEELKRKVMLAREEANRIKVGVTFYPNVSLQLRNPDVLSHADTYNQMSLYFRTKSTEGLLAYVGNEIGTHTRMKRTTTDDFMALEIRGGRVVLIMFLGSGLDEIMNDQYVADNKWHQVTVERVGKTVTLTIKTEDEPDNVKEGQLPGDHSVFNLDQNLSKFYIGGIPDFTGVQPEVRNRRFEGEIEEVEFGKTPLGLWNFVKGENNVFGAKKRDELVEKKTPNALRFDGNGYAILKRGRESFTYTVFATASFRTYAKDGLMFLIGNAEKQPVTYLAVEMQDGHVVLKFNMGDGMAQVRSPKKFNDGKWHTFDASRDKKLGSLKIDEEVQGTVQTGGRLQQLYTTDELFVGGYPGAHGFADVTNIGFEGCIKDMQLESNIKDLTKYKEAFGVIRGCPDTLVRTVSFSKEVPGYVALKTVDLKGYVDLTFKFKTEEPDGLIFFAANDDQSHYLAIFLAQGSLVMRCEPGGEIRTPPGMMFNDKEWHYIIATKVRRQLSLDIDDLTSLEVNVTTNTVVEITTPLYFGGVPQDYLLTPPPLLGIRNFVGCLGDTTVMGKVQNFADTSDKPGASLASCPLAPEGAAPPPLPPPTTKTRVTARPTPSLPSPTMATPTTTEAMEEVEPTPVGQCMLPLPPRTDKEVSPQDGHQFGLTPWSRIEYTLRNEMVSSLLDSSHLSIYFRSTQENGVLLYVGADQVDFIGLVMVGGKLAYLYNCGTGIANLQTEGTYNDGEWHVATLTRKGKLGRLEVDGEKVTGESPGSTSSLNVKSPLLVGGLSEKLAKEAKNNLMDITNSFPGCIRKVELQGESFEPLQGSKLDVMPCSRKVEDGTFFSANGGYIVLYDSFKVGPDITVQMEIKPRNLSGVLMAIHSRRTNDYLSLQMIDGAVKFAVDNGAGVIEAKFVPNEQHLLCDGNWHQIQAVKTRNVVTLTIDDEGAVTTFGKGGVSSTDTIDPLYFGGVPEEEDLLGLDTRQPFTGCIRNLELNSQLQNLAQARIFGQIFLSFCPTI